VRDGLHGLVCGDLRDAARAGDQLGAQRGGLRHLAGVVEEHLLAV
jgi:hypothetical protein